MTTEPLPFSDTGGSVALDVITEQFELDRERKQSFEQRGLAVVAASGAFVSILFAIGSRTGTAFLVPHWARLFVFVALGLLAVAAVCGIAAAIPRTFNVADLDYLRSLIADDVWVGSGIKTSQRIAEGKLKMLERHRNRTRLKGVALIIGMGAEAVAVVLLAVALSLNCQGDGVTVAKYVLSGSVAVGAEKNGMKFGPIAVIPS